MFTFINDYFKVTPLEQISTSPNNPMRLTMSILDQASKPIPQAPIITIVGTPGGGKTSLAGLFPHSVFIQSENSQTVFESWPEIDQPTMLPQLPHSNSKSNIRTSSVLKDYLIALIQDDHKYKTVIFDSTSTLNTMFEEEVIEFDKNKPDSIGSAAGGFHKGYDVVAGMHSIILRAAEALQKKGIAVIFLCHSGNVKMKNQPDEAKEYTAFSLDMHEKSRKLYVAKSDAVLYLKQKKYIVGGETDRKGNQTKTARVQSCGERELITSSDGRIGYIDAKNRYGLPIEIEVPLGSNPLLDLVPFFNSRKEG